jgi:hypothetical protein
MKPGAYGASILPAFIVDFPPSQLFHRLGFLLTETD